MVRIYSDSSYLVNCFQQGWHKNWVKNGWKTSQKKPVENRELWEKLLSLSEGQTIEYYLVKGHLKISEDGAALRGAHKKYSAHNGPCSLEEFRRIAAMNNRADELANEFIKQAAGKAPDERTPKEE